MVHNIQVQVNRFEVLQVNPNAWQILVDRSLSVSTGDTINVMEVDSLSLPTGRNRVGLVYFVGSPNDFIYDGDFEMIYVVCALGVGFDKVGSSFLVS